MLMQYLTGRLPRYQRHYHERVRPISRILCRLPYQLWSPVSIASSLISRLMLNLRDPHLLRNRYNDSRVSELEHSELPWCPRTNTAACSSADSSDAFTSSS